ncbi:hypothetical protein D0Z07_5327 [Hyphodiscus hymeniophilus]|uniref:DUF676 domain-containing protein n=1 Tax=Hyphodiscus hymeniophilus TaxID=353542 RepID=A0A9P6VIP3_9HELO|nr:hypothetical protein D0Z07_5327 [Hyphodiscus hymeniophilus]
MVKTVFICFIHGFKGNEETFYHFPDDLRRLVQEQVPDLNVHTELYPKYDTRGDLAVCVEAFKDWLQGKITDLETKAENKNAIKDPSVGVILVAHSVGGLVAADTLFSVLDNRPVSLDPNTKLMFPLIHGLIAFDTPYNGLARSMFAYGAFSQYQNINSLWSVGTSVGALLTSGGVSSVSGAAAASNQLASSQSPKWKRYQLLAARTGTYGAILAGGVAAYMNRAEIAEGFSKLNEGKLSESWSKVSWENTREGISQIPAYVSRESIGGGFTWMASHLKFVGALMKPAQLKMRLERLGALKGIGVADLYTSLGENGYWSGGYFVPKRTFCAVPRAPEEEARIFTEWPNEKAADEIAAHCSMFRPENNPKYEQMAEKTRDLVVQFLKNDPRSVVDEYKPSQSQRQRSMSEAHLWDDDGNVKGGVAEIKNDEDDEQQLKAILAQSDMPEPVNGGVTDEELQKAAELPLPVEDVDEEDMKKLLDGDGEKEASTTWRSSFAVDTDDAPKRKADEAFPAESEKEGEESQRTAEEQLLEQSSDAAGTDVPSGKGEEAVKEAEKLPGEVEKPHQEPQNDEDGKVDQKLPGLSAPQGDALKQADEKVAEEPKHIQIDEGTKEKEGIAEP